MPVPDPPESFSPLAAVTVPAATVRPPPVPVRLIVVSEVPVKVKLDPAMAAAADTVNVLEVFLNVPPWMAPDPVKFTADVKDPALRDAVPSVSVVPVISPEAEILPELAEFLSMSPRTVPVVVMFPDPAFTEVPVMPPAPIVPKVVKFPDPKAREVPVRAAPVISPAPTEPVVVMFPDPKDREVPVMAPKFVILAVLEVF